MVVVNALAHHWPEYLTEGALLGAFMVSACVSVVLLEHPASPLRRGIASAFARRSIVGVLMGLTAVALIYSGPGRRSGAHMNPAVTVAFLSLGRVRPWDAGFYVLAQVAGGLAGVLASRAVLGRAIAHPSVNYVVTAPPLAEPPRARGRVVPRPSAAGAAWIAEFVISFGMMAVVLAATSVPDAAPYTGLFAGTLVAAYIAVEAPLSGMSINPARTLASAIPARSYRALWVYLTAPPLAMLAAAALFPAAGGPTPCPTLMHPDGPCVFCAGDGPARPRGSVRSPVPPSDDEARSSRF